VSFTPDPECGAVTLLLAGAAGILLAASAGLRAFLPLLGLGLAARFLGWPIADSMQWLLTDAGLIGLTVAALAEVAADKVPAVDHFLDMIHTVTGPLAGALVAFTAWGELPTTSGMILALALGAPIAGGVHLMAAATRIKSTVLTAGIGNPAVSVAEDGVSIGAIVIAILAPLVAVFLALFVLFLVGRFVYRRMRPQAVS
jgi:hypothetical protein